MYKAKLVRILTPLVSLFPPSSGISIRLGWLKIPASRDKRWYGNTIRHISLGNIQSGKGGESAETGPTINGSLSNNLFDRKLVTHLPVLQMGIRPEKKIKSIVLYLCLIRHPDRQRRRRAIITNSGTMIRLMTPLGIVYDLHTIIDNFSSAFPVGFDR